MYIHTYQYRARKHRTTARKRKSEESEIMYRGGWAGICSFKVPCKYYAFIYGKYVCVCVCVCVIYAYLFIRFFKNLCLHTYKHTYIQGAKETSLDLTTDGDCTITVYVRRGSLIMSNTDKTEVRCGDVVVFRSPSERYGRLNNGDRDQAVATLTAGIDGLDCLVLTGKPLNEPVLAQGPLVHADEESFRKSAQCFNSIGREGYWDHTITDEEWKIHCKNLDLQQVITNSGI
jgi:hypothetical protein